jgi:hypothetical protein
MPDAAPPTTISLEVVNDARSHLAADENFRYRVTVDMVTSTSGPYYNRQHRAASEAREHEGGPGPNATGFRAKGSGNLNVF